MIKLPHFHLIEFLNNPKTGWFEKSPSIYSFMKLPFELKIEPTQDQQIISQGANSIITSRIKDGKRGFFTGLIPLFGNWYYGNHYEFIKGKKVLSLIIFKFSDDQSTLIVRYFNHFYKESRTERENFCKNLINQYETK